MVDFVKAMEVALNTGKVVVGFKSVLKKLMSKDLPKLVIAAKNTPEQNLERIRYYCKLSKVPFYLFDGSSKELGDICGKPFVISAIAIIDPGESDILSITEENA